ncbi:MAG: membrane protein insertase YidC [Candidatus Aminicenantes bacterium]|nr:MAG: membrane protein insertase YidC [Candidatus Aminicenantes bacterium]
MEKRLLLAIVLSFIVLFLFQAIFLKQAPPKAPPDRTTLAEKGFEKKPGQKESFPRPEPPQQKEATKKEKPIQPVRAEQEKNIVINTSLYQAVWSNKGAVLKSWKLKEHKDENQEDLELVSLHSIDIGRFPFSLITEDPQFDNVINNSLYEPSNLKIELEDGQQAELRFLYADEAGTKVEKAFIFLGGKYGFDIKINVLKNSQKIEPYLLWGPGLRNPTPAELKQRFGSSKGVAIFSADRVERQEEKKFNLERSAFNFVNWAAYEDNYFTALFLASPQKSSAAFIKQEMNEQLSYFFLSVNYPQRAFIGPKDVDALSEFGYNAKKLIKFGFFGWIAEILLRAMKFCYAFIPNWGLSIIIVTFIIKILFFPLTYSSTRSMARMQELQPKIKAIRARYKKAKQDIDQRRKMNEETMKLYKEHGINPVGGCLPMLIQLPIFWGFFQILRTSVEFRHSPFILWINDLSVKDPYYVTPILMGITMFISQKMTPTGADPTQQKMMLIMPVVMTIFFMNFQSGLVLYWLTVNVLQIGQQYIMNRMRKKKKRELHGKRRKK